jgi:flagellar hook-basal body complex protein FliE
LSIASIGASSGFSTLPNLQAQSTGLVGNSSGQGFGAILKSFTEGTINSLQNGEQTAIAAIQGKTSIQNAVMATMEAEQSLQAALAIRDKVVSAFLEISRMQI